MNIYVGNLAYDASEDEVRQAFEAYGQVSQVNLIIDRETNRPRGFGFVEMPNDSEAQSAINALNGQMLKNRPLVVNPARPKEEGGRRSGGFGDRRGGGGDRGGGNRRGGFRNDRNRTW